MEGEHRKENSRQSGQQIQKGRHRICFETLVIEDSNYGALETGGAIFQNGFWLKKFSKLKSWFRNGMGIRTGQTDLHFNSVCS